MLINCSDPNSLQKLKTQLNEELCHNFNIYERKKLHPRIMMYSVEENPKNDTNFVEKLVEDNHFFERY